MTQLFSQNGWPASPDRKAIRVKNYLIPGAKRHLACAEDVAPILVEFAAWFHKYIEPIDVGKWDDWGYHFALIPGSPDLANHASGTAEDLNAIKHRWMALKSGFTPLQEIRIRWKCRALKMRWGWDYKKRKDPMHFEFIGTPADAKAIIAKLKLPRPKEGTVG